PDRVRPVGHAPQRGRETGLDDGAGIVLAETLITGLLTAALAIGVSVLGMKALVTFAGSSQPFLQGMQFPWDAGVAGVIAGLVAGVLGGFVPAVRAAGIPIATVMRA
ncbi:hypothetical protein AB0C31_19785, partial [Actinoplanes philippinensis]